MTYDYYYYTLHEDNARYGSLFDDVLRGVQVALPFLGKIFNGGSGSGGNSCAGQARGLQAITACSAQLLQALDAIQAQILQPNLTQPYQQFIDQANILVQTLSNSQYFYQAQHGDDAAALANAKTQANAKLQRIIQTANAAAQNPIGTGIGQGGQIIGSGGNAITTGLDSVSRLLSDPIVLYGGLGLLAYSLLRKRK